MTLEEQIKTMSDEELLEKLKIIDTYFKNVQKLIVKEIIDRNLMNKEDLKEIFYKKNRPTKKKESKVPIVILITIIFAFLIFNGVSIYKKAKNRKEYVKPVNQRVYNGEYEGRIEEKYPNVLPKIPNFRETLLKSISTKKESEDKNFFYTKCYDKKGRLVYSIEQSKYQQKVGERGSKGYTYQIEVLTPKEEGFIYDDKDRVIQSFVAPGGMTYRIEKYSKDALYSFFKRGGTAIILKTITYPTTDKRIEIEESVAKGIWQNYYKNEKIYINNILMNDKTWEDQERDDSFIMATTEKKYNEKGELIYKTVERKDKTNDYKSFTEMDFSKDEIITKYYKGKDVFATVTETLVGPVETIEKTEMVMGEKIKKTYKNKVKAIVKRQKVGEPVKIVDVIEYVPKEIREKNKEKYHGWAIDNTRYIFNDKGELIYKIRGIKASIFTYLYDDLQRDLNNMKEGVYHESFFQTNYDTSEYQAFLFSIYRIQKYDLTNNKIIDMRIINGDRKNEKCFDEEVNITSLRINESNLEKISDEKMENNEIKTLEELLNGYKYE